MRPILANFLTLCAFISVSAPVFADDCANAMLGTARQPYSTLVTKIDGQGKQSQTHMVQMPTAQYVQTEDGQWHSTAVTVQDMLEATTDEVKTSKLTCKRVGSDTLNGVSAAVYALHIEGDDTIADSRIWIASNLIMRSDSTVQGLRFTVLYDYSHVTAPANAKPIGVR